MRSLALYSNYYSIETIGNLGILQTNMVLWVHTCVASFKFLHMREPKALHLLARFSELESVVSLPSKELTDP